MELGTKLKEMKDGLEQGTDVDLVFPGTSKPIGIKVRVASGESERARAYLRQQANENMKNPAHRPTAEESEARGRAFLVSLTLGWTWGTSINPETKQEEPITIDGEVWPFVPDKVDEFYRRFPQFAGQVDRASSDVSRFYKA